VDVIIYEPTLKAEEFNGCKVVNDFNSFAKESDEILVNFNENYCKQLFSVIEYEK